MDMCIICGSQIIKPSVEHIIPEAIGGKLTIRSVCATCNNSLGRLVDDKLVNDGFFVMLRDMFSVKNRDGKTVDPFSHFTFFDMDGNKVIHKRSKLEGKAFIYDGTQAPSVEISENPDNSLHFNISGSDYDSIFQKMRRVTKKQGIEMSDDQIESLLSQTLNVKMEYTKAKTPIMRNNQNYIPCMIKIAYEFACLRLGEQYKQDEYGKRIREYLYGIIQSDSNSKQIVLDDVTLIDCKAQPRPLHVLMLKSEDANVYVETSLFLTVTMKVCVSKNAAKYKTELESINPYCQNC